MTTPATPLDRAKRVQELSAKATEGPWTYEFAYNNAGLPTGDLKAPGRNDGATIELLEIDCMMITEGRDLAPALAEDVTQLVALWDLCKPLCQHVPEVAAKARELGLLPERKEESDG